MIMKLNRSVLFPLILLALATAALLPLLYHPLKWDAIDQAYPWKYFIGQCLQEGTLPLWNPYQLLGSPIHADPQSSAWYPVTWFFGFFSGYSIWVLSIDFFLHIYLAGAGMYYLGRQLRFREETALLMGIAYMLSGFFTGNAQHFMWIISGTWIPFIIGAFIALKERPSVHSATRLGLAFFMIMTGGYPAFIFLLLYLLTAIFLLFLSGYLRGNDRASMLRYLKFLGLAAAFTLLAGAVVIVSVYHLQGAMTRSEGVTLRQALFGAFTLRSLVSFLVPFAAIRDPEFYGTDLSMTNGYFGLIPLVFFLAALMIRRPGIINLFLVWGLFCLAAAVGNALPIREFLYHHVPLMNYFRFPALFRVFLILGFLVTAGYAFNEWISGNPKLAGRMKIAAGVAGILLLFFIVRALMEGVGDMGEFLRGELFRFSEKSTIAQHTLFQGLIQLTLLSFFAWVVFLRKKKNYVTAAVLGILCLDMALAFRLNGPYTVYSDLFRSKEVHAHARQFPDGFPLPGHGPVLDNRDQGKLIYQTLWRNLNIFHRQVSWEGYNPLHLKGFEEMADNHPDVFNAILQNPLVYLSDHISPLDSMALHEAGQDFDPRRVYFRTEDYVRLKGEDFRLKIGDSLVVTGFSPVEVRTRARVSGKGLVNLLQNDYYGWKAFINGEEVEILTGNMGFIAAVVPPGDHEIVFSYRPDTVKAAFWLTVISLIAGVIALFARRVK